MRQMKKTIPCRCDLLLHPKRSLRYSVIGIDIGLNGGITVSKDGKVSVYKMPLKNKAVDTDAIAGIVRETNPDVVVYEDIGQIYKTSKKTAFVMGQQKGELRGICSALDVNQLAIDPKKWQQYIFLREVVKEIRKENKKRDTKAMARIAFDKITKRFFGEPATHFEDALRKKAYVVNDGVIDSFLITCYVYDVVKEIQS